MDYRSVLRYDVLSPRQSDRVRLRGFLLQRRVLQFRYSVDAAYGRNPFDHRAEGRPGDYGDAYSGRRRRDVSVVSRNGGDPGRDVGDVRSYGRRPRTHADGYGDGNRRLRRFGDRDGVVERRSCGFEAGRSGPVDSCQDEHGGSNFHCRGRERVDVYRRVQSEFRFQRRVDEDVRSFRLEVDYRPVLRRDVLFPR